MTSIFVVLLVVFVCVHENFGVSDDMRGVHVQDKISFLCHVCFDDCRKWEKGPAGIMVSSPSLF